MIPQLIHQHRTAIDALDTELLDLLHRRARHAQAIGRLKGGRTPWRPDREAEVLRRVTSGPGPLPPPSLEAIWREIMGACRDLEGPTVVAVPPLPGLLTARSHFGAAALLVSCPTPEAALEHLVAGGADAALLPLDPRALGALLASGLPVVGETADRTLVVGTRPVPPTGLDRELWWMPEEPMADAAWMKPLSMGSVGAFDLPPSPDQGRCLGRYPRP